MFNTYSFHDTLYSCICLASFRFFPLFETATMTSTWNVEMNFMGFLSNHFITITPLLCTVMFALFQFTAETFFLFSRSQIHLNDFSSKEDKDLVKYKNCPPHPMCVLYKMWFHKFYNNLAHFETISWVTTCQI
jgi:hypothetical protein